MLTMWKRFVAMIVRKQQSVFSAAIVIMSTVLLSRFLGLVRERLLLMYFSPDQLGPYHAAFRIPNLIFELLVVGAVSTAFIPVFTNTWVKRGKVYAFELGNHVINLSLVGVVILLLPLYLFAQPLSYILVPGFSPAERDLFVSFTRIIMLGQLIPFVIGNFIAGMLQSFQRFLIPALAPVAYNVGIVIGVILFSTKFGLYAPVLGVVLGAFLYLVIQVPLLVKFGFRYSLTMKMHQQELRQMFRLMLPRTFGVAVSQIDATIDLILASLLGSRNVSLFFYAQQLQQVPIGLFGATFAQAAFPSFSAE
ncbi:MAG: lipid II flippase MurJ, partial [Patescibacteria group bacterium]